MSATDVRGRKDRADEAMNVILKHNLLGFLTSVKNGNISLKDQSAFLDVISHTFNSLFIDALEHYFKLDKENVIAKKLKNDLLDSLCIKLVSLSTGEFQLGFCVIIKDVVDTIIDDDDVEHVKTISLSAIFPDGELVCSIPTLSLNTDNDLRTSAEAFLTIAETAYHKWMNV